VPPGADPASAVAVPVPVGRGDSGGARAAPGDSTSPVRAGRYRGEPAFVTGGSNVVEYATDEHGAPRVPAPSRWPMVLAAAVVLAAGAVAIALYLHQREQPAATPVAVVAIDAAIAQPPAIDAPVPVVIDVTPDAGPVVDAQVGGVRPADARGKAAKADAAIPSNVVLTPLGNVAVKVITDPDGGTVYDGNQFIGSGHPTFERPYGTKAHLRCLTPGYREGKVDVTFDGKSAVAYCRMERIPNCVDGTKNPFDNCPDARPDD